MSIETAPESPGRNSPKKSFPLGTLIFLIILAAGSAAAWRWRAPLMAKLDVLKPKAPTSQPSRPPTAVNFAVAKKGDLPIMLTGIGNVAAFNSVTIKSRVDGQLLKVQFTEGQTVKEGDVLVEIDPRQYQVQLAQAQGQLAKDTASLNNARLDVERYTTASEAVSRQQLDNAKAAVAQFEGIVQSDEAQVANVKLLLSYCTIASPITGRIGFRKVDVGNMVRAADPNGLADITQLQPISVLFFLPEDKLPLVRKALAADNSLEVEAWNRDMKTRLAVGRLAAIDNQIDAASAQIRFKAHFDNADSSLYPNQFVNVRLQVDLLKGIILIPPVAVQHDAQGTAFVYVINEGVVEKRNVTEGPADGVNAAISAGLAAGEKIVVDGIDKLTPGAKVITRDADGASGRPSSRPSRSN